MAILIGEAGAGAASAAAAARTLGPARQFLFEFLVAEVTGRGGVSPGSLVDESLNSISSDDRRLLFDTLLCVSAGRAATDAADSEDTVDSERAVPEGACG